MTSQIIREYDNAIAEFYAAYWRWARYERAWTMFKPFLQKPPAIFSHQDGLCMAFTRWMDSNAIVSWYDHRYYIAHRMRLQFEEAGLNDQYPFGGVERYERDYRSRSMHLNNARFKWVAKRRKR